MMQKQKAIVLSSGGLDSTTCVGLAVAKFGAHNVMTVSIYYGQRHEKELSCARAIADYYHVEHEELDLYNIFKHSNCSLLASSTEKIPEKSYADQIAESGMVSTYVPFRNGLMLSAAASLAQSRYPDDNIAIYIGAHADDAAENAYADCSVQFMQCINEAIRIGTYHRVFIEAPFIKMNKAEVVKTGLSIHVPYELTWSCYQGGTVPCGKCGTCIDRINAFKANGIPDPYLEKLKVAESCSAS